MRKYRKYRVEYTITTHYVTHVQAANLVQAFDRAEEAIANGDGSDVDTTSEVQRVETVDA